MPIPHHTIGTEVFPGYAFDAVTAEGEEALRLFAREGLWRILVLDEGSLSLGEEGTFCTPLVAWVDERSALPRLRPDQESARRCIALAFHPRALNNRLEYPVLRGDAASLSISDSQDLFFLSPFLDRALGEGPSAVELAYAEAPAFARIIGVVRDLLRATSVDSWPCRSRCLIIELLFALRQLDDRRRGEASMGRETTGFPVAAADAPPPPAALGQDLAARAASLIEEWIPSRFTIEDIARALATNRTTLEESFRRRFNARVIEYARAMRMRRARALLRNTTLSVEHIMARVGYNDPSSFSRAFRASAGTSPRAYREDHCWMLGGS